MFGILLPQPELSSRKIRGGLTLLENRVAGPPGDGRLPMETITIFVQGEIGMSETRRKGYRRALLAFSMAVGAVMAGTAYALPNAAWNDGAKGASPVSFWVYDREGACETLRTEDSTPIVLGTKVKVGEASGPLTLKDLKFCLVYDTPQSAKNCSRASVEFAQDPQTREYRGKYEVVFGDKSTRKGEFRAQYCKPKEPKKK